MWLYLTNAITFETNISGYSCSYNAWYCKCWCLVVSACLWRQFPTNMFYMCMCTCVDRSIYTSGQRYGINTAKWHLRESDRYLLFLVVCLIAERNAVDFIDPLRSQIEWPNTVSIVWGPLRLKRRKRVSSGEVTSSEVCLAITTLML